MRNIRSKNYKWTLEMTKKYYMMSCKSMRQRYNNTFKLQKLDKNKETQKTKQNENLLVPRLKYIVVNKNA